jgi:hypothetical protein
MQIYSKKVLRFALFLMILNIPQPLLGARLAFSTPKVLASAIACFIVGALVQGGMDNHRALNVPRSSMWDDTKWYKPTPGERVQFFCNGFFDVTENARRKQDEIKSIFGYGSAQNEKRKNSLWKRLKVIAHKMRDFAKNNKPLEYGTLLAIAILTLHILDRCGKFDSSASSAQQQGPEEDVVGAASGSGSFSAAPRPTMTSTGTSPQPTSSTPEEQQSLLRSIAARLHAAVQPPPRTEQQAAAPAQPRAEPQNQQQHSAQGHRAPPAQARQSSTPGPQPQSSFRQTASSSSSGDQQQEENKESVGGEDKSWSSGFMKFFKEIIGTSHALAKALKSFFKYFGWW